MFGADAGFFIPQTELAFVGVLAVWVEGPVVVGNHRGGKCPL